MAVDYVLPLRWDAAASQSGRDELTSYLAQLRRWVDDVVVVDGSEPELFDEHHRLWSPIVRHVPPQARTANGKVGGVMTGIRAARSPVVVLADDDVRYGPDELAEVVARLRRADVVVPQNVFSSLPWHARWDTARSLVNRALRTDYPGTVVVRRDVAVLGYRGDVLFENLELIRTVAARGGRVEIARDLFVPRLPPTAAHFRSQRVRQAYDSCAQPARLAVELAILPAALLQARRPRGYVVWVLAVVALAERGRRVDGGRRVYPASASWWAPLWVGERAVTSWLALACHVRGGVPYAGGRLRHAATSPRALRAGERLRALADRPSRAGAR
ncbi:glycosyltransferase [Janibacter sp. UYMM211]|uniref:glycosyltransferase n=1 Tax=Janibacter sp. UYMM211 TaxID=3156342 RepID=UPI00339165EC